MKMDNKQRNIMILGWIAGRAARGLEAEKGARPMPEIYKREEQ